MSGTAPSGQPVRLAPSATPGRDRRTVTVADLDGERARTVADEVGGEAWQLDLGDTAAVADLSVDVDVQVNNAGFQHVAPVHEFPPERFSTIGRVMLEAPILLIRAALRGMCWRGFGRIVNISSVHGLRVSADKSAYVAARHGLAASFLTGSAVTVDGGWTAR